MTPLGKHDDERKAVDAGGRRCNRASVELFKQTIHIHPLSLPPHSFLFSQCPSLSYLPSIPPLPQDQPAVPPLAYPFALSPQSLRLPQLPPLVYPRNCRNSTLLPQTLLPPCPCTLLRSPLHSLPLFCLPGGLSHQRRQPFCIFLLLLLGPLFVVALIQGLLPSSSQGLAPPQRRGAFLCPQALCTSLTTRVHHLHIESIGVVRPWTVSSKSSFTSRLTTQPLMMATTPLLPPTVATSPLKTSRSSLSGVY